jgi:hypothetical protein
MLKTLLTGGRFYSASVTPDAEVAMTTWQDLFAPGNAEDFFDPRPAQPFNAGNRAYDPVNARWLMELSRLVYREDDRARFLARAELEELAFIESLAPDTQGYLVSPQSREWAALVFRGTSTLKDFWIDSRFTMAPWDHGDVHKGFKEGIEAVWNEVVEQLDQLPRTCAVYYAGHSLGAALATLASSRRKPTALYTFGSPLVGNRAFAATVADTPIFRVVDHNDLVTHVPPPLLFLAYKHVGEEHKLEHPASDPRDSVQELTELVGHFVRNPRTFFKEVEHTLPGPPDPLADHAPINYLHRIA